MSIEPSDSSLETAASSLMNILPDDGLNHGNTDPADNQGAGDPQQPPAQAQDNADPQQPPQQPGADEDAEIEYEGERYKVPGKLKDAFLRQADYTRKTQELANQRREIDSKSSELKDIDNYKQKLTRYEQLLGEQVLADQKINWKELLEKDPIEYLRQKEMSEARAKEHADLQEKRNKENEAQHLQTLQQEGQQLIAKRPEWKDEKVWNAEREKISNFLQNQGYRQEEINAVTDHRVLLIVDKARKYDELMAANKDTAKKIEKLPPKIERPGVPSGADGQASRDAMSKLRKTGSVDDAAAAIRSLMG